MGTSGNKGEQENLTEEEHEGRPRKRWRITQTCVLCRLFIIFLSLLCIPHRNKLCHHSPPTSYNWTHILDDYCV